MGTIFFAITIIICLAALLSLFFRVFSQPVILAYILTGIIIAHTGFFTSQSQQVLQGFAEVGITLLLFMLGLEIKLSELPTIGKVALIVGSIQMTLSFGIAYLLCIIMGFSTIDSVYLGLAIMFSSTIILVKLLSDKKDLHSLYGKISIGISLLQDIVAIAILIILSSFSLNFSAQNIPLALFALFYKGLLVIVLVMIVSKFILPRILHFVSHSSETLFLFSLAWVFGMAAFVSSPYIGFSIEIGGFIAGLALSTSTENYQIAARMKTLRDFFIILFFVLLGMQMRFTNIVSLIMPAIVLSVVALFIKPFLVMISMGLLRYRRRTGFFTGINIGQISEFSLILIFVGSRLGHIENNIVSLVTFVSIITFTISTYLIINNSKIYHGIHQHLRIFERKEKIDEIGEVGELENHVVLIGAHRMGESILEALSKMKEDVVVVDFDPDVIEKLKEKEVKNLFGDITDLDIQERAQLHNAKLVISTVPDVEDNILLIKHMNQLNRKAKIVVIGLDKQEAKLLYKAGADYVVIPHLTGGVHVARLLRENSFKHVEKMKEQDLLSFL